MRKGTGKIVGEILETDEYAREDDNYLIMRFVQIVEPNLAGTTFVNVMKGLKYKGISFESITRARRKYMNKHPQLKNRQAEQARAEEEEKYILEYSNHIPNIL